jgi:hypothetical protein
MPRILATPVRRPIDASRPRDNPTPVRPLASAEGTYIGEQMLLHPSCAGGSVRNRSWSAGACRNRCWLRSDGSPTTFEKCPFGVLANNYMPLALSSAHLKILCRKTVLLGEFCVRILSLLRQISKSKKPVNKKLHKGEEIRTQRSRNMNFL